VQEQSSEAVVSLSVLHRLTVERMTIQRMENVGIVVDDLAAATAFFVERGLKLHGEGPLEGDWVDRAVGLEGVPGAIASIHRADDPRIPPAYAVRRSSSSGTVVRNP
jgi:catechol 2,3-dioxygenase-like lactoylglutathione lyase family enzyme